MAHGLFGTYILFIHSIIAKPIVARLANVSRTGTRTYTISFLLGKYGTERRLLIINNYNKRYTRGYPSVRRVYKANHPRKNNERRVTNPILFSNENCGNRNLCGCSRAYAVLLTLLYSNSFCKIFNDI